MANIDKTMKEMKTKSHFCDNGCPVEKPIHARAHVRRYRDRLIPVRDYCRRRPRRRN